MIAKVFWYVEGRVLGVEYEGKFGPNDTRPIMHIVDGLIEHFGKPPLVHIIYVQREGNAPIPENVRMQDAVDQARGHKPPSMLGYMLFVGEKHSPMMHFFAKMVAHLLKLRVRLVHNVDEAIALIRDRDETLSDAHFCPSTEATQDLRALLPG